MDICIGMAINMDDGVDCEDSSLFFMFNPKFIRARGISYLNSSLMLKNQ